jgi:hypothetical protein
MEEICFLYDPCQDVISKRQSVSSVRESVKKKTCAGGKRLPIVAAVTRKHLVTE